MKQILVGAARLTQLTIFLGAAAGSAVAQTPDVPGVTNSEIRIGQTNPYSGPVANLGVNGKADIAYIKWLNDKGGVNGRTVRLTSLDDGYVPPRTLEQTRKLVEQDNVAFVYKSMGTGPNSAITKYLNDRRVPHIFASVGNAKFFNPAETPWLVPFYLRFVDEAKVTAKHLAKTRPDAKIAVLFQNDDFGRDFLSGIREALGSNADRMLIKQSSVEVTDPSVDSQIISLAETKADVLYLAAVAPRPVTQAIRKAADLGWSPTFVLPSVTNTPEVVLKPAGLNNAKGALTVNFLKDPNSSQYSNDDDVKEWHAWMNKYLPGADKTNTFYVTSFFAGSMLAHVLTKAGDDLSRENILAQAINMRELKFPMLLPGITVSTSPSDYRLIRKMQMFRFDGSSWRPMGNVVSADD
ncbi:ABC transporter substrate-binding protein [Pseudorhodoplanes sp.]|uniref:ABC transporter substrate-binding protein n=1 Tax=Pseudorhodoplanes sp. TaxID=1934341 RepID=UPI003D0C9418